MVNFYLHTNFVEMVQVYLIIFQPRSEINGMVDKNVRVKLHLMMVMVMVMMFETIE